MIVFTLCTSTNSFRVLSHQVGKSSISLVVECSIIYDGKKFAKVRKKFKKHYLSSNQKLASTQTLGSAFLDRIRKVQNSKYEHDLLKIIDCFIDGYGFVNSDHVNFSIKNLKTKKNHRCQKHLQNNFQTCKKDVIFF